MDDILGLITGCVNGWDSSLREFVRKFHPAIASTVIKTAHRYGDLSAKCADDLIQEVYVRIFEDGCRVLRQFEIRDETGIFGFVQAVAYSTVYDQYRRTVAHKRGGNVAPVGLDVATLASASNPTVDYERRLLLQKIDSVIVKVAVPPNGDRDRTIFWLYYREGLTARDIGAMPSIGLSPKGVESVIHRLTGELRRRFREPGEEGIGGRI